MVKGKFYSLCFSVFPKSSTNKRMLLSFFFFKGYTWNILDCGSAQAFSLVLGTRMEAFTFKSWYCLDRYILQITEPLGMEGGLGPSGVEEIKLARQVGVESPFFIEGGREGDSAWGAPSLCRLRSCWLLVAQGLIYFSFYVCEQGQFA